MTRYRVDRWTFLPASKWTIDRRTPHLRAENDEALEECRRIFPVPFSGLSARYLRLDVPGPERYALARDRWSWHASFLLTSGLLSIASDRAALSAFRKPNSLVCESLTVVNCPVAVGLEKLNPNTESAESGGLLVIQIAGVARTGLLSHGPRLN